MSELGWIGTFVYVATIAALGLLQAVLIGIGPGLKRHEAPIKVILFGILAVSAGYWWVTVPVPTNVSIDSPLENRTNQRKSEALTDLGQNVEEQHQKIQSLERKIEVLREDSSKLHRHYELVLGLAVFGIIFTGAGLLFIKTAPPPTDATQLDTSE